MIQQIQIKSTSELTVRRRIGGKTLQTKATLATSQPFQDGPLKRKLLAKKYQIDDASQLTSRPIISNKSSKSWARW